MLFPLMPNRHFLADFGNAKRLYLLCLMRQKHCWNYFALNQSFDWRQNSSSSSFASWGKIKIHVFTLADQDWIGPMILKILRIRTGSDSILSDQGWTRTEKFHSPLISAVDVFGMGWAITRSCQGAFAEMLLKMTHDPTYSSWTPRGLLQTRSMQVRNQGNAGGRSFP